MHRHRMVVLCFTRLGGRGLWEDTWSRVVGRASTLYYFTVALHYYVTNVCTYEIIRVDISNQAYSMVTRRGLSTSSLAFLT
jgi:hypothetical protein